MPSWPPTKLLRPAVPPDQVFFLEVYMGTRWEEAMAMPWDDRQRRAFLRQQYEAQTRDWTARYPRLQRWVILAQGRPAGRLFLHHDAATSDVRVVDIALLPALRGQNLGTRALQQVCAEADGRGWSVSLHVFPENRARSLYARHGFAPVRMAGDRLLLVRPARSPAVPSLSVSAPTSPASGSPDTPLPLAETENGPASLAGAGKHNP